MVIPTIGQIRNVSRVAINESSQAQLPGRENGPADAYRHILLAAELTRLYGEAIARIILEQHEIEGKIDGQSAESEAMDRHNNKIGISIGKTSGSWEDTVDQTRGVMDEGIG